MNTVFCLVLEKFPYPSYKMNYVFTSKIFRVLHFPFRYFIQLKWIFMCDLRQRSIYVSSIWINTCSSKLNCVHFCGFPTDLQCHLSSIKFLCIYGIYVWAFNLPHPHPVPLCLMALGFIFCIAVKYYNCTNIIHLLFHPFNQC